MYIFYEQLWVGTDKLTVYIKIEQDAKILIVDCAKLGRRSKKYTCFWKRILLSHELQLFLYLTLILYVILLTILYIKIYNLTIKNRK